MVDTAGDTHKVPGTREERRELRELVAADVAGRGLGAPLSMGTLEALAGELIAAHGLDAGLRGWLMVEISNAVWREAVAAVPPERRILLLPQCLRREGVCTAPVDEIGLLCRRCGSCKIVGLEDRAAALGVMSIVAEGFTAAVELIKQGVVDAVIGVSCLESLEKAFPLMIAGAVPGVAVALNGAGCRDTDVDEDRVMELLEMLSDGGATRPAPVDYRLLDDTVRDWFSAESLAATILPGGDHTSKVALDWMTAGGKRWRPYLLAATYMALSGSRELPDRVRQAALAVECFHKASLVHDDVQDGDERRGELETVHARHGVPIAINVGDMLLGEGYRLLAGCGDVEMISAIARAHVALCRGQGTELEWRRERTLPDEAMVLDIFRGKTVPAFAVSFELGAICAGASAEVRRLLADYSEALGIAYQLRDDLEDEPDDAPALPREKAVELAEKYRRRATEIAEQVNGAELRRLLFRVTERILK